MKRLAFVLLGLFSTATVGISAPQLDLPKERRRPPETAGKGTDEAAAKGSESPAERRGDIASGSVTDLEKNEPLVDKDGRQIGIKTTKRVNAPGRSSRRGKLMLPDARREAAPSSNPEEALETAVDPPSADPFEERENVTPVDFPTSRNSARFLYEALVRADRPSDPEVTEAADRLSRLGEDGLQVARFALREDDEVLVFAGARALLIAGTAEDADDIVFRLRGALPGKAGPLVLDELVERDPVRGNEELLADLLRHDSAILRRAAKKRLAERLDSNEADVLAPALQDSSTEVRRAAVELLAGLDGPLPTGLLMDHVTDRSSSVAQVAIRGLRFAEGEDVDRELLRRAMESGEILRREALLLVAIAEREDRMTRPILGPQHAPPLVAALKSPLAIVQSSAAISLAGIGFRSAETEGTSWMDDAVPSTLVGVAAGFTFFDGLEIVREPALRRMRLISGVSHGSNGPAWARWWARNKAGFSASRAVLEIPADEEGRIVVTVRDASSLRPFVLAGPALAKDEAWLTESPDVVGSYAEMRSRADVTFMTPGDASDLVALLREEGVLSADRLPGARGLVGADGRSLDVALGAAGKSFRFGPGRSEDWFDRALTRANGLRERNAWQRYAVDGVHEDRLELYLAESPWWSESHTPEERRERLKDQLVQHLSAGLANERGPAIDELERLVQEDPTLLGADEIPGLLELLVQEPRFNDRSASLVSLLRIAGAAGTQDLSRSAAVEVLGTLHDRFGASALPAIKEVLVDQGRDAVLTGVVDDRGLVRVAAAQALGDGDEEQDIDLLLAMLRDPDTDVETAAVRSLGLRRAEEAREPILLRAVGGKPQVRSAALRAIGDLGGPNAIDALVEGLTDRDERYHLPAAEGLAKLGTEDAAPLLISLLRAQARPAVRAEAIRGLADLGPLAYSELFGAMRSPDPELRRDAALILARQLEPRAVPTLAQALAENPTDDVVAMELVLLTCVDLREEPLPAEAWFRWWDEVDRRDEFAWFVAALERRNVRPPEREQFIAPGTEEARLFLLTLVSDLFDPLLAERARRELERLHGSELEPLPSDPRERALWLETTRAAVLAESAEATGVPPFDAEASDR